MPSAVKAVATVPVFAKLTSDITDVVPIAAAAQRGGVDAVTLINTLVGMAVDWRRKKPVLGNTTGGLSGPAIKPVAMRIVYQVRQALPDLPILAVGGAHSAECVLEFVCAGANAVQFGTSMFSDPTLMTRVVQELEQRLRSERTSIRELSGAMHARGSAGASHTAAAAAHAAVPVGNVPVGNSVRGGNQCG